MAAVESCLAPRMAATLNAEIAIGTVSSIEECIGYLDWTFYARRARMNPSYYGAKSSDDADIAEFLHQKVLGCLQELQEDRCIICDEDEIHVRPTPLGIAASKFYLNPKTPRQMENGSKDTRRLMKHLKEAFGELSDERKHVTGPYTITFQAQVEEIAVASILYALSQTEEFAELPVRHNEEHLNEDLNESLPWGPLVPRAGEKGLVAIVDYDEDIMAEPHTK